MGSLFPEPPMRFLAFVIVTSACLAQEKSPLQLPATYVGKLPCADCPGIILTLTLYPDHAYFLRNKYLERESVFVDRGKWEAVGNKLTLRGGGENPQYFLARSPNTIEQLDVAGEPIQSKLNFKLQRAKTLDRFHDPISWRGMYLYMADAASFTDCLAGRRYPVAMLERAADLERAYLAARKESGQPLLVTFNGRLADQPKMEGKGTTEMLVVTAEPRALPGESCTSKP